MMSLSGVVGIIVYLLIAGAIFALLHWLINYVGAQFPGSEPFIRIARIILMILGVLVLIGILVSFIGGTPVFRA